MYFALTLANMALATALFLNQSSRAEASSFGSFKLCDQRNNQGNCQGFDLPQYKQNKVYAINFNVESGYRNYNNLGENSYVRFEDEQGTILCTLSKETGFTIRSTKFYTTDIAAFQWGLINQTNRPLPSDLKPTKEIGYFELCDQNHFRGNCKSFYLSHYNKGRLHVIDFPAKSINYRGLGRDARVQFIEQSGRKMDNLQGDWRGSRQIPATAYDNPIWAFQWNHAPQHSHKPSSSLRGGHQ